jgi:hypothetical protein
MNHNSYSDASWCIQNDYQVYIKPIDGQFCIAIRRGGISSCGKDWHMEKGVEYTSSEVLGSMRYKTVEKATEKIPEVYKYLKERHR